MLADEQLPRGFFQPTRSLRDMEPVEEGVDLLDRLVRRLLHDEMPLVPADALDGQPGARVHPAGPHRRHVELRPQVVDRVQHVARDGDLPPRGLIRDLHVVVGRRAGRVVVDAGVRDRQLVEEVLVHGPGVVGLEDLDAHGVQAGAVGEDLPDPRAAAVGHDDVGCERLLGQEGPVEVVHRPGGVGEGGVLFDGGHDVGEEDAERGDAWECVDRDGGAVHGAGAPVVAGQNDGGVVAVDGLYSFHDRASEGSFIGASDARGGESVARLLSRGQP